MNKLTLYLIFAATNIALAGQESIHLPDGAAAWTINFQQNGRPRQDGDPPALHRIEVAQTASARRSIFYWSDGRSKEMWSLPGSGLWITEDPKGNAFVTKSGARYGDAFGEADFAWIQPDTRVGDKPVQYGATTCFHYKGAITVTKESKDLAPDTSATIPCEAWVDAKTLLPVAMLKGNVLGTFTFGNPPATLEMPEKFRKRLDYYKLTMGMH